MRIFKFLMFWALSFVMGSCVYLPVDDCHCCHDCVDPDREDDKKLPEGAVDLGLSVAWASCNVGADSPEDFGDYYSWGDTTLKNVFADSTYSVKTYGLDIATEKMGRRWRMPTKYEVEELMARCNIKWVVQNNVEGILVSTRNGGSIFLPSAGTIDGTKVDSGRVAIWTTHQYLEEGDYATIFFSDGGRNNGAVGMELKYKGIPVRAVCEK